jgi:tRNA-dihydrouridine synthase C
MEGVVDPLTRELLTGVGGIGQCVTEFVRVTNQLLPRKVFYRFAPELRHEGELRGKTKHGVPTFVQLLGSDHGALAENAARAAELGALGVDLNFGCPAKTVNRHNGGACLLQWPEQLHGIVAAVRAAVPADIPVTAKMRLGFEDKALAIENAQALEAGGAAWVTVHARTKVEAYKPPAHWEWLARVNQALSVPVVANGEIWTLEDWRRCQAVSECEHFMLGRGAIACPDLPRQIHHAMQGTDYSSMDWPQALDVVANYFRTSLPQVAKPHQAVSRMKQWLKQLPRNYEQAEPMFAEIRRQREPDEVLSILGRYEAEAALPLVP